MHLHIPFASTCRLLQRHQLEALGFSLETLRRDLVHACRAITLLSSEIMSNMHTVICTCVSECASEESRVCVTHAYVSKTILTHASVSNLSYIRDIVRLPSWRTERAPQLSSDAVRSFGVSSVPGRHTLTPCVDGALSVWHRHR